MFIQGLLTCFSLTFGAKFACMELLVVIYENLSLNIKDVMVKS